MRSLLITLVIFPFTFCLGQKTKDTRALVPGSFKEHSVSPGGKIRAMNADGEVYYTSEEDSGWHFISSIAPPDDEYSPPQFDHLYFFNEDTGIVSGYIYTPGRDSTDGYFLTEDGGKTWKLLSFGASAWVYDNYHDRAGNSWLGGAGKRISFSPDYGHTWTQLILPYKHSDRIYALRMIDALRGIVGSDRNEILTTKDNWKTVTYIPTPLDEGKVKSNDLHDTRLDKVAIWREYLVAKQEGRVFYTDAAEVAWKTFPIDIVDFEVDVTTGKLYVITNELKTGVYSSPANFRIIDDKKLPFSPDYMQVHNGTLYALCHGLQDPPTIYRINNEGRRAYPLYTYDRSIPAPDKIVYGKKLVWGVSWNSIYLSENSGGDWYRVKTVDRTLFDASLLNDSTALFTDLNYDLFMFSLKDSVLRPYSHPHPLESFFTYPLKEMTISVVASGCFHYNEDVIVYKKRNDTSFSVDDYRRSKDNREPEGGKSHRTPFKKKISSAGLTDILKTINENPAAVPSIGDLKITSEDKKNYLKWMNDQIKSTNYDSRNYSKMDASLVNAVPDMVDTFSDRTVKALLDMDEGIMSTSHMYVIIDIVNVNNDSVHAEHPYYHNSTPWHLPWNFRCQGRLFKSYSIDFSRYIMNAMPKDMMARESFDNKYFLVEAARYFYWKEKAADHNR